MIRFVLTDLGMTLTLFRFLILKHFPSLIIF